MATYNIAEAKAHFSRLIRAVTDGEEVIFARAGEPILQMVRVVKPETPRRCFGENFLGITFIAPDFFEDIPLDAFEVFREDAPPDVQTPK